MKIIIKIRYFVAKFGGRIRTVIRELSQVNTEATSTTSEYSKVN